MLYCLNCLDNLFLRSEGEEGGKEVWITGFEGWRGGQNNEMKRVIRDRVLGV